MKGTARTPGNIWLPAKKAAPTSPALSPEEEAKTFSLPPGYHAQLVAAEPLIESPIIVDFDPDGRMWVLELQAFLPDTSGRDTQDPVCDVAVLEDVDGDGRMDKRTVFADRLVLPRALKVLDHGVLVGEPPNLWLMKDTDGDLRADTKEVVYKNYGRFIGGIEHNANGLLWGMDNVLYTSEWNENLRLKNGRFEVLPSLSRGQWQASQDDAGRVFRNVNDAPLFVDYTPARYFLRNPNAARTRGLYESLIDQMAATVYPLRQNRGVNRGYRDPFFREDGSSIVIQGAGSPTVYRGDRYPADVRGSVFITDSPTNLVHRFDIVDDGTGRLTAKNSYARGEFLASSDERFRPVNLSSAPDGTMYVVDMYRGVVQDGGIWSDYLRDYIKSHDLELPVKQGRIWRVVYGTGAAARGPKPSLSSASPPELVKALSHPNGWWRDTAQRLLVERGETSVAPSLRTLAASAPDWRTKLHALWTLDGLEAIDPASVEKALSDQRSEVRAAAVRIAERYLGSADPSIVKAVLALAEDRNWNVRRQVAASIGELPASARKDPALAMLRKSGSDPIIVDAVVSGIAGAEEQVLGDLLHADAPRIEYVGGDRRTRGGNHAKWRRGSRSKVARAGHRRRTSRRRTIGRTSGDRQGSTGVRSGGRPRGPAGRKSCRPQHSRSRGSVHSRTAGDAGRRAHRVGSPRLWLGAACDRREVGCEQVGLAEQAGSGRHRSAPEPCAAAAICLRRRDLQGTLRRMPSGGREGKGQGRRESRGFSLCEERRSERRHPGVALGEGRHYRTDATRRRHL